MSTTVCHTQHESLLVLKQPGRYQNWPSSSSERTGRQPTLRILTTESSLPDVHHTDRMAPRAERSAASTSRTGPNDVPDVIRDPSRSSINASGATPAHPFPSSSSPSATHGHIRAKSTTEHIENASASLDHRATRRARAASSATLGRQPRLPSMLSSLLTHHRTPVQPRTAARDPDLVGSFTPTSSPRPRLQSLLSGLGAGSSDSFFATGASPSQPPPPSSRFATATRSLSRARHQSEGPRVRVRAPAAAAIDAPASPTLPSICRTPSSYSGSDYFASTTAPSSAGPATPVHTATALPLPGAGGAGRKSGDCLTLHPVLEDLERSSMFRVQTACATCGKRGSNFPTCPKCGEMWCSRVCRLQKGDGKRHICAKRC